MLSVGVMGPKEPCNQVSTFYEGDGLYTITYQPCVRGTHKIVLKWGRQSIAGSPFKVVVV